MQKTCLQGAAEINNKLQTVGTTEFVQSVETLHFSQQSLMELCGSNFCRNASFMTVVDAEETFVAIAYETVEENCPDNFPARKLVTSHKAEFSNKTQQNDQA